MTGASDPAEDRLRRTGVSILKLLAENWLEQVVPGGKITIDIAKIINREFKLWSPQEATEALSHTSIYDAEKIARDTFQSAKWSQELSKLDEANWSF